MLDKWETIHRYRRNSNIGKVPAIKCPDDDTELVPTIDKHQEPALRCFTCSTVYAISVGVWDQIISNLREINE